MFSAEIHIHKQNAWINNHIHQDGLNTYVSIDTTHTIPNETRSENVDHGFLISQSTPDVDANANARLFLLSLLLGCFLCIFCPRSAQIREASHSRRPPPLGACAPTTEALRAPLIHLWCLRSVLLLRYRTWMHIAAGAARRREPLRERQLLRVYLVEPQASSP